MPVLSKGGRILQSGRTQIPRDSLVGEWLLEGNANDTSGNGYNGTVTGATLSTNRFGEPNKAYRFTGSTDNINFGDILDLGLNDRSISIWAKKTIVTAGGLIYKGSPAGFTPWSYGIMCSSIFFTQYYFDVNISPNNLLIQSISNTKILTAWSHIVITLKRNGSFKVYVDNVLRGTLSASVSELVDFQSSFNLIIGNVSGLYSTANADICDARMYNKELTTQEIALLYNETKTTVATADMSWQLKIDNWLTGNESYLTKSGNKVLTWTDKVNGNVWTDFDGTIDATHISGNNYLTFNAGGLVNLTATQNSKEIYVVHYDETQGLYNYIMCVYDGIQGAYTGVESFNGAVFYSDFTSGTIYYKRDRVIGSKTVYNSSWTSHGIRNGMLIGVRANKAFPLQGRIYEFLTFTSKLTETERAGLNLYMKSLHTDIVNI